MLASIHPLGERARRNRFWLTATAYVAGSVAGGAAVGATVGTLGAVVSAVAGRPPALALWCLAVAACGAAAVVDALGMRLPSPRRQVNQDWLGTYRGWVYGGGFGLQLGAGVTTVVTTATVHLMLVLSFLTLSPVAGLAVGAVFGLTRAAPLWRVARVERPDALRAALARMAAGHGLARRLGSIGAATAAAVVVGSAALGAR